MLRGPQNFILFGVGFVAERHLKVMKKLGHNLVGALDTHDSVGILDRYFPECAFFTEPERFDRWLSTMATRGDAKIPTWATVCSPNWLHDAHIRMAMRAGCDVICEKPVVITPSNITYLADAESEYGQTVHVVHQLRFHRDIMDLKNKETATVRPPTQPAEVDLTYCAPRGPWYSRSWKGDEKRSGGIIMNLGIHFLDALIWIYGPVMDEKVYERTETTMAGFINLQHARVRFLLSTDFKHAVDGRPKRVMKVDGKRAFDFSRKFGDLHEEVYRAAHVDHMDSVGLDDALPAIELAHNLRHAPIVYRDEDEE